ncbi:hypothetical protein AB0B45_46410 [Nonomuraea sp. NPDC049152]|uniref:hypothetical protein n=1 Tax=Nonomuraea sp. NPDC049152 TaxID=3154350 RepID=UPI0033C43B74
MGSARPGAIGVFGQGSGRVDVARAISQQVTADPPSIGFGLRAWPHTDDQPVTRKLTYTNAGAEPVTLDLAVKAVDGAGKPIGTTPFSLSAKTVTVPAGGTAEVSVNRWAPRSSSPAVSVTTSA